MHPRKIADQVPVNTEINSNKKHAICSYNQKDFMPIALCAFVVCAFVGFVSRPITHNDAILILPVGLDRGLSLEVPGDQCDWKFVSYHPSEYEVAWKKDILINQDAVCKQQDTTYKHYVDEYLNSSRLLTTQEFPGTWQMKKCSRETYAEPATLPKRTFSAFEYERTCTQPQSLKQNKLVFIEPLAGVLRHPNACARARANVGRKDYMSVDGWAVHNAGAGNKDNERWDGRRYFYFDLGASTFTTGAGGTSQPWFRALFGDLCVKFDHYYAWEGVPVAPDQVFQSIPGDVVPKYHWFNIFATTGVGHKHNPLTILLSETRPKDFVVFKLDVDNYGVEEALVHQILETPALHERIDEMFWEHHVNFKPMTNFWMGQTHVELKQNDSLALFSRLRSKGIRVHSWV